MPGETPPDPDLDALVREVAVLSDADPASCIVRARIALAAAERGGDHARVARILCDRGYAANRISQPLPARADYERALGLARELGDREIEALAYNGLGGAAHNLGEFGRALGHFEAALAIRRERGDREGVIACLNNIALCHTSLLQFDQAESLHQEGLLLAQKLGARSVEAIIQANLAALHLAHAEMLIEAGAGAAEPLIEASLRAATVAVDLAAEAGIEAWLISAQSQLASSLAAAGHAEAALELAEKTLQRAPALGMIEIQVDARLVKGRLLLRAGDTAAAIEQLNEAVGHAEQFSHRELMRSALRLLAEAHEAAGNSAAALALFRRYHRLTLAQRDRAAEQRAESLAASLQLERSRHEAELARLRTRELETANQALFTQAMQDALTGLPNRRQLEADLTERMARGEQLAFVMADVDHFKAINDSYSHPVGDAVLREIGELLHQHCRLGDLAARVGGEEFALVLSDVDGSAAAAISERVRSAIVRHDWSPLHPGLRVTMSFGLAWARSRGDSPASLIARADAALYRAKTAGRNRVLTEFL